MIEASLQPDKVYDVVIDISMGWWTANIYLTPIVAEAKRRADLSDWEAKEDLLIFDAEDPGIARIEDKYRERNEKAIEDFVNGDKNDRLGHLEPGDHR